MQQIPPDCRAIGENSFKVWTSSINGPRTQTRMMLTSPPRMPLYTNSSAESTSLKRNLGLTPERATASLLEIFGTSVAYSAGHRLASAFRRTESGIARDCRRPAPVSSFVRSSVAPEQEIPGILRPSGFYIARTIITESGEYHANNERTAPPCRRGRGPVADDCRPPCGSTCRVRQ